MTVFLIGFMGAGKTTLGRALATQLGYLFFDLDEVIEQQSGCSVPDLFVRYGESEFRNMEQQALYHIVRTQQENARNCIIACGGGTPCYGQNLAFMKASGFVIYIEVPPEILCERLRQPPACNGSNPPATANTRPLLPCHDPEQLLPHIRRLLARRSPFYEAAHWRCQVIQLPRAL